MTSQSQKQNAPEFYRFQVVQGAVADDGKFKKQKSVGMAYLKAGTSIYTLRLWMFLSERFYVLPNRNDSSKYWVLTREPNNKPGAKNKYFWNIVGNGRAISELGHIRLEFDLLEKPVFMPMFPEFSANTMTLADPATDAEPAESLDVPEAA